MADPTIILADKRARIASLEAALDGERAELRGMEMMAKMLAAEPREFAPMPAQAKMTDLDWDRAREAYRTVAKGRQPGSISKRWRSVLWRLDQMGGNFSPLSIVDTVRELEQREMRPADAKRQMENYAVFGFIAASGDVFNVTDEFRSKFANGASGSDENEASEADAKDASETALHAQHGVPQE